MLMLLLAGNCEFLHKFGSTLNVISMEFSRLSELFLRNLWKTPSNAEFTANCNFPSLCPKIV